MFGCWQRLVMVRGKLWSLLLETKQNLSLTLTIWFFFSPVIFGVSVTSLAYCTVNVIHAEILFVSVT